jgi:hypothetical protein
MENALCEGDIADNWESFIGTSLHHWWYIENNLKP